MQWKERSTFLTIIKAIHSVSTTDGYSNRSDHAATCPLWRPGCLTSSRYVAARRPAPAAVPGFRRPGVSSGSKPRLCSPSLNDRHNLRSRQPEAAQASPSTDGPEAASRHALWRERPLSPLDSRDHVGAGAASADRSREAWRVYVRVAGGSAAFLCGGAAR